MYKFIFLTFAFLAWAFYEMSGGADFAPTQRATAEPATPAADTEAPIVEAKSTAAAKPAPLPARPEPAAEVTRATYTAPSYNLRAPAEEELAAVDPAVLTTFASVLKKEEDIAKIEVAAVNAEQIAVDPVTDLREVTGNRVNMRNGPGTSYSVVDRLQRGDTVEVLAEPGNGWLKLRVAGSGQVGWMADFLVSSAD
jgi:hypothetical protein